MQAAHAAGHPIDFVSNAKACDTGSDSFYDTRQVNAENGGERLTRMGGVPRMDLEVERIDAARIDPEHLACVPRKRAKSAYHLRIKGFSARPGHPHPRLRQ